MQQTAGTVCSMGEGEDSHCLVLIIVPQSRCLGQPTYCQQTRKRFKGFVTIVSGFRDNGLGDWALYGKGPLVKNSLSWDLEHAVQSSHYALLPLKLFNGNV